MQTMFFVDRASELPKLNSDLDHRQKYLRRAHNGR
jgi:hypothetical protein